MNTSQITAEQLELFIFILLRVSAMVVTIPIFGNRNVPVRAKAGLSLMIAFLLFPFIKFHLPSLEILPLISGMVGEVIIGVIIGFAGKLVFAGVQIAGQLIGFQMGFAIVNVFDPITSEQVSIIAQFQYLIAMLIFLAVDGHHVFLYAIAESYRIVFPLDFHFSAELMQAIVEISKDIFIIAVKIGAPIITALLMTSIGFGLIARTVPQINILIVGFPIKIAIGLIGIGLTLPLLTKIMSRVFLNYGDKLNVLLHLM
ncbi:MAG: flagellar type III secretion system protein FliR [Deltaproteobacteria bacterium]|nr:flagellar type III secretion system protein FliR [Deltaproteobacteria bacterium]MBW1718205.1 flagellar type III secretion system protein FliR [Deltaproteobacteria bacterium]MBW1938161.1 flagellar type III secretion system protein FliR [Deltaproteobacteria bacterium]